MQKIIIKKLDGLGEVYNNNLAPMYKMHIPTEPVMGVLWIDALLKRIPPIERIILSPVGAHIGNLTFGYWSNIHSYLEKYQKAIKESHIEAPPIGFYDNVAMILKDPWKCFALTSLLFAEGQMKVFSLSPHPAQEVLLKLLEPIVINRKAPLYFPDVKPGLFNQVNCQIEVVLLAGKKPLVNTFHPESTVNRWFNELEAATVLLILQILIATEANLPSDKKEFFLDALSNMVKEWQQWLPGIRTFQLWNWLPTIAE